MVWQFTLHWSFKVNAASGLLLVALGLLVARMRGSSRAALAFAAFAIFFGLGLVPNNLLAFTRETNTVQAVLHVAFFVPAAIALTLVGTRFPSDLPGLRRDAAVPYILVPAGLLALVWAAGSNSDAWLEPAPAQGSPLGIAVIGIAFNLVVAAHVLVLALLPLRFRVASRRRSVEKAREVVFLSVALTLFPAMLIGSRLISANSHIVFTASGVLAIVLVAMAWLWMTLTLPAGARRTARNLALFTLAILFAGTALRFVVPPGWRFATLGLSRTLGVVIVAYAIVRHQMMGIDLKVRWTLSKSTVAATFVATFFIVSEVAQEFFGNRAGNQYFGVFAAGALVFAISPLSRFADRLAAKAVPLSPGGPSAAPARMHEEAYRSALRRYLRDGRLASHEEMDLARLAEALSLTPTRAAALRIEVENDRTANRRPSRRRAKS